MAVCCIHPKKHHKSVGQYLPAQNFLDWMTLPHRFLLSLIGLGDNNFQCRSFRVLYYAYFLVMIGLQIVCLVWNVFLYLDEYGVKVFNITMQEEHENLVDAYAELGRRTVFYYRQLVTAIFLIWAVPSKKFSHLSHFWNERKDLARLEAVLYRRSPGQILTKGQRYLVVSYGILLLFMANVLSVDISFFLVEAESAFGKISGILSRFLPNIVMTLILARACATYLCTALIWDCYNESFSSDTDHKSDKSTTDLIREHSNGYDALSDFTEMVAGCFRYYNTVHVATVAALVAAVYESIYSSMPVSAKTMCWIFELMHLSAFFMAATVYASCAVTPRRVYKFYKKKMEQEDVIKTDITFFDSFHHYVAHQWGPVSLDIAGILSINFATVGVLVFTAINWIGVIIQFRQGTGDATNQGQIACRDVLAYLQHGNVSAHA